MQQPGGGDAGGGAGGGGGSVAGGSGGSGGAGGAAGGGGLAGGGAAGGLSAAGGAAGHGTQIGDAPGGGSAGGGGGSAGQLVFVTPARTALAGGCSAAVTVESHDGQGAVLAAQVPVMVVVSVPGLAFFSDAACATAPISASQIAAGSSSTTVYWRGSTGGTLTVTASASGFQSASQQAVVIAAVRSGTCNLAGASTTSCAVSPPVTDLSHAMMFFQAASSSNSPNNGEVRCRLTSAAQISCDRAGNGGTARIVWSVAELPSGLDVQRVPTPPCNSSSVDVPIAAVDTGSTFVTDATLAGGNDFNHDDFATVSLNAPDNVRLEYGAMKACNGTWAGEVQVVTVAGASVTRGLVMPALDAGTSAITVSNLPPVNLGTTALLVSHRIGDTAAAQMCDRALRAELTSPTSITFTRTPGSPCDGTLVEAIAWQRVDFGARGRVVSMLVRADAGVGMVSAAIPSVDLTRSFSLSTVFGPSGDGLGECTYAQDDVLGECLGTFTLTSPTGLTVQRDSSNGTTQWSAQVIELQP
jgi:hypothetical protein